MVKLSILTLTLIGLTAPGAYAGKLRLSQKDVAELVLKQGPDTEKANDKYLQSRFEPAKTLLPYDWTASFESGYQFDKEETLARAATPGASFKSWLTTASLKKSFTTGTLLNLSYTQTSQNADYNLGSTALTAAQVTKATQDEFGVTVEQSLLNNAFGVGDRATVRSAQKIFASAGIQRVNSLEDVVLNAISQYWQAYVAQETFREALASRDRFKNLLAQVRRKSSVGYANPGELAQAQADYETQEQTVKTSSTDYLAQLDNLMVTLNLPAGTEVEFDVSEKVPPLPKLSKVKVEDLRSVRAAQLTLEASEEDLTAAKSRQYPVVNLVGKYYTSGYDETSDGAFSRLSATTHPRYYVGAKLSYSFGSDYQSEDLINKKVNRDLQTTNLALERINRANLLAQDERNVESTYAILQSAARQKEYRERAVQELTRTYTQGRTDIKTLIDAINNQFATEIRWSRAIGDYQIALNKWAANRDELIPDSERNGVTK